MDGQLCYLRLTYAQVAEQVTVALQTQVGDTPRLSELRTQALSLGIMACQHRHVFAPVEYQTLQTSVERMVEEIDYYSGQLNDLRHAYAELVEQAIVALETQVGDALRLSEVRAQALELGSVAEQHRVVFPPAEYQTLLTSIERIVAELDAAYDECVDTPDALHTPVIQTIRTGRRGRPPKVIDPSFLQNAWDLHGSGRIARLLDCSPRTVRRAAVRYGLASPGARVVRTMRHPEGTATTSVPNIC